MMRRLYHLGVQDKHRTLINSLHTNASSAVKFNGLVSDIFEIQQGEDQGGVLSADLYKIYVDPLLHRLKHSGLGMKIGNIQCPASACADDIAINNTNLEEAQILLNMVYDYNCKEHYKLQPQKSVVIDMSSQKKRGKSTPNQLQLDGTNLQNVEKTAHLGIQRSKTDKDTIENTVNENITKARRTAYSPMSAGFHGNNGLDPSTCIHIMKTYVIPTLLYGLEVITPDKKNLEKLEKFHKRMVKQILSLP
jgi:hypothetical protein